MAMGVHIDTHEIFNIFAGCHDIAMRTRRHTREHGLVMMMVSWYSLDNFFALKKKELPTQNPQEA